MPLNAPILKLVDSCTITFIEGVCVISLYDPFYQLRLSFTHPLVLQYSAGSTELTLGAMRFVRV